MENNKTALLITYYWPPAGGAGVHRWLRMSRFFKENGWNLHVYCPDNGAWPIIDEKLIDEVSSDLTIVRRSIFEPHRLLGEKNNPNKGAGITQTKKASFKQKAIIWVRGNLFIPDARKFWIRPSARFLNKYLQDHPDISTIISTGPPHSMHLIAQKLKRRNPKLKWIADFRDPWTEIDFFNELMPSKNTLEKHQTMEKSVLKEADRVVTVSDATAEGLERIAQRKIEVVTNGYIFPQSMVKEVQLDSNFTIAHFGSMPASRNPKVLWEALHILVSKNKDFADKLSIRLIGSVDVKVRENLDSLELSKYVEFIPSVSHGESIQLQARTQLLLLVANNSGNVKGILTGKFFEYLASNRPIIAVGEKDSDLHEAMNNTNAGSFIGFEDTASAIEYLSACFEKYKNGQLIAETKNFDQYDTRQLTKKFCSLMD